MTQSREQPAFSKDALLARFLGNSLEHDQEDVAFWRTASDELRGQTLYRLLLQGRYITKAAPNAIAPREDRTRLVLKSKAMSLITDYE